MAALSDPTGSPAASGPVIGFLGVGTINSAVCRGLCTLPREGDVPLRAPSRVLLSPRGAAKAAALAADFPDQCAVCATNQDVVDGADVVFLACLPAQAAEVCAALKFRGDGSQTVVSLLAGVDHASVCAMAAPVPAARVARAVPLPPVKDHKGVTIYYARPGDADGDATGALVGRVFGALGTAVPCANETTMATLQVNTAMMGNYYALLQAMHGWTVANGVDADAASTFIGALMHSVAADGKAAGGGGFDALIAEQTPGGYNEMGIRELREAGVYDEVALTMGSIAARWAGRADHKRPRRTYVVADDAGEDAKPASK